jgi:hypothetical protein
MEIKKCPSCNKTVLAISKTCKHCGISFEENRAAQENVNETQVAPPLVIEQQLTNKNVNLENSGYNLSKQKMFKNPFSFEGRIRRLEYGLSIIIFGTAATFSSTIYILLIPAYWFILAQGAKRCHDRNHSGWYQLIPFYILWMLFAEGNLGKNRYGNPPK